MKVPPTFLKCCTQGARNSKLNFHFRYHSFYGQNQIADIGNIRYYTYRDNLVLELSLAGSWITFALMTIIFILLLTLKKLTRLTDESKFGSAYDENSIWKTEDYLER